MTDTEREIERRLREADVRHAEKQIAQIDRDIARLQKRRAELTREIERLQARKDDTP